MAKSERLKQAVVKNFLAGLSVLVPLYFTVYILTVFVSAFDDIAQVLPERLDYLRFPGMGLLLTLLAAMGIGVFVRFFIGKTLLRAMNSLIGRVPVVASIYNLFRQVSEAMLGDGSRSFSRVVLVEWPRRESWMLAFVTGETSAVVTEGLKDRKCLNLFIPTTPNPTSGFYFIVRADDVIDVPISVDQAFKTIVSAGAFPLETQIYREKA